MRIQILKEGKFGLWVGSQVDFDNLHNPEEWAVIHACKEPYHRAALRYSGRAAPKDHPEYLYALRPINARQPNRLILNLVDVENPEYISPIIITRALGFIAENIGKKEVLVHCNQGMSRSPTIGMLYLGWMGLGRNFEAAEEAFRRIYPMYSPANGMREMARKRWTFPDPVQTTSDGESKE